MFNRLVITIIITCLVGCQAEKKPLTPQLTYNQVDTDFFELDTLQASPYCIETWTLDIEPSLGVVVLLHDQMHNTAVWNDAQILYKNGYSVMLSALPQMEDTNLVGYTHQLSHWATLVYSHARNQLTNKNIIIYSRGIAGFAACSAHQQLYPRPQCMVMENPLFTQASLVQSLGAHGYSIPFYNQWPFMFSKERPNDGMYALSQANWPVLFLTGSPQKHPSSTETSKAYEWYPHKKQLTQFETKGLQSLGKSVPKQWEYIVINFLKSHR